MPMSPNLRRARILMVCVVHLSLKQTDMNGIGEWRRISGTMVMVSDDEDR